MHTHLEQQFDEKNLIWIFLLSCFIILRRCMEMESALLWLVVRLRPSLRTFTIRCVRILIESRNLLSSSLRSRSALCSASCPTPSLLGFWIIIASAFGLIVMFWWLVIRLLRVRVFVILFWVRIFVSIFFVPIVFFIFSIALSWIQFLIFFIGIRSVVTLFVVFLITITS